ncbi:MAG: metal ABC transporter substrate-binding protein [Candidatus Sericytochromatia bacterium]|nr:metal ABC transporter substrate-binding protein [Candidatus Sericytochromatia bacterium]
MWRRVAWLLALASLLVSCGQPGSQDGPRLVATTTMVADMVRQIAGHRLRVQGLLTPGADPHIYRPVPRDAEAIAQAPLVFSHGLHLEPWLPDLVRQSGGKGRQVVVAEGLANRRSPTDASLPDPHIWFDVPRWRRTIPRVVQALSAHDPAGRQVFEANARLYDQQLGLLDAWIRRELAQVPRARRRLVTSHDAFGYFGAAYGFEVVPIQGVSTESEAGTQDLVRVVQRVKQAQVPMVFVETSVNARLVEQVARETGARVGGPLYSDACGAFDTSGGSYVGMLRDNVAVIVEGLQ